MNGLVQPALRETPRYGADVAALLTEIGSKFGIND
jgi:hypothetical protein